MEIPGPRPGPRQGVTPWTPIVRMGKARTPAVLLASPKLAYSGFALPKTTLFDLNGSVLIHSAVSVSQEEPHDPFLPPSCFRHRRLCFGRLSVCYRTGHCRGGTFRRGYRQGTGREISRPRARAVG
ncbi:hypothetical protein KL86DPRO_11956 [uncultured delta proteobacterium]|uniref:Uncharacterized protein n=1 Tax=uncultured delta proteobacterium TaxID=34034 RepID=A0A212JPN3_9DELT|nr:hypothetical protein KL86DPRO_11956 [uncultured delta proteobacterium]